MDPFSSATELATAIAHRELSPVELLEHCLDEVDRLDPHLHAIIWRNDDEARTSARHWAEVIARGHDDLPPFAGVPLPVKDLTAVAGWPVTFGSRGAPEGPSDRSEMVVDNLVRAGFVLTGRTNTPELGPITVTENLRYGITTNPWDTARSPGGSSGGAAAAVASGMFPVAHANDGGGSIRIPASCTGLVGLKPSRGRVPAMIPGWFGATVEGAVTRTVGDAAAVLDAIRGPDPLSWLNIPAPDRPFATEVGADPGRLRVGILTRAPLDLPVDPEALEAVARTAAALEGLGHHVEPVAFELFPFEALASFLPVINAGLGDHPEVDFEKAEPHIRAGYAAARELDSIALVGTLATLQRYAHSLLGRWGEEFDLLVTPTMAIAPPRAGTVLEKVHQHPSDTAPEVLSMAVFTGVFNVTGQPAISLPLHWSADGLPVGVQIVAGPWQEGLLVRVAAQLELALPWEGRRPPLVAG